jgi:hypothetical protein
MDWKNLIYETIKKRQCPLIISECEETISAESLWVEIRGWIKTFREFGLGKGDRIKLEMDTLPSYLGAFLAGLWEELQIIIEDGSENQELKGENRQLICADLILKNDTIVESDAWTNLDENLSEENIEARIIFLKSESILPYSDDDLFRILNSYQVKNKFLGKKVLSLSSWFREKGVTQELLPGIFLSELIVQGKKNWKISKTLDVRKKYLINLIKGGKDYGQEDRQLVLF